MQRGNIARTIAGLFIMLSLYLGTQYPNNHWFWFAALVGFSLFQSGLTKFYPLEKILKTPNIGKV